MLNLSRRSFLAAAAMGAATLAGCGGADSSSSAESGSATDAGASEADDVTQLTVEPGKLTVATGNPAYPPYVIDDDPTNKEGFEAALTYAVAAQMGFADKDVTWTRTGFDEAITPGEKDWDMNVQQYSITEERKKAVDFSTPYFTPSQSIVVDTAEGHDAFAKATTVAELKDAVLGAEAGSTSYTWGLKINDNVQVFDSNADAANALNAHQIDGIVFDTPTAVYIADPDMDELSSAAIIGQIPDSEADPLAFLLPKDSPLTEHVNAAVDALVASGELQKITDKWMASYTTEVPTLG